MLHLTKSEWWWDRQVGSNQYGLPGRAEKKWGPGSLEGDLSPEELLSNRADQPLDTAKHKYRDEDYYLSRDYDLADIQVPLLSVANWVGASVDPSADVPTDLFFSCREASCFTFAAMS